MPKRKFEVDLETVGNLTVSGTGSFNGILTGPTAPIGTNTIQTATTAFVDNSAVLKGTTEEKYIIVCDGDSRTAGYTGTTEWKYSDNLALGSSYSVYNTAVGGATLTNNLASSVTWISQDAFKTVDSKQSRFAKNNICVIWAGYNDMAVRDKNENTTFDALVSYCLARKKQGFKVIVLNEPNYAPGTPETRRLAFNELVRSKWGSFADGFVDVGNNPYLGGTGAYANTTYFFDGVHMTSTGYAQITAAVQVEILRINNIAEKYFSKQVIIQDTNSPGTISTTKMLSFAGQMNDGVAYPNAIDFRMGRYSNNIGGNFLPATSFEIWLKSTAINNITADFKALEIRDNGNAIFTGSVSGNSFIKTGGLVAEVLLANGANVAGGISGYVLTSTGAATAPTWQAAGSGSMIYPTGTGIAVVTGGASWGTTLDPATFIRTTGTQTISAGSLTFTAQTGGAGSGLNLLNNSTSGGDKVLYVQVGTLGVGSGASIVNYGTSTSTGVTLTNLSTSGTGLYVDNQQSGTGVGIKISNTGALGYGLDLTTVTGVGARISGSSSGILLVLDSIFGTGLLYSGRNNAVETSSISRTGDIRTATNIGFTQATAAPAAETGIGIAYGFARSGKPTLSLKGPLGTGKALDFSPMDCNTCLWLPTTATAGTWVGTVGAGAGTFAAILPASGSILAQIKRSRYANVITTTNQVLGQRGTEALFHRGSVANTGGFHFYARFTADTWTNGGRLFVGMHTGTTVISADPSALANTIGFGVDAADNGLIYFITRDATTGNKTTTGLTCVTGKAYDVFMFCYPNDSTVYYRIVDLITSTAVEGSRTSNLPVNTTMLTPGVLASNAALTPATSINIGVAKVYTETEN